MKRSPIDLTGFHRPSAPVASQRLLRAVAGSLALGAGFCVAITALSIKLALTLPAFG